MKTIVRQLGRTKPGKSPECLNDKLSEIWQLITQSPTSFKGGTLWNVVSSIHGALQAIGYALLVLFFVVGVMKTCGSLTEVKRPEHALRLFVRFALAKGVISYGMDLMLALLDIVQGVISTIMQAAGLWSAPVRGAAIRNCLGH